MVPRRGLEPPQCCHRQDLNLVRLPIPPPGHVFKLDSDYSVFANPVNQSFQKIFTSRKICIRARGAAKHSAQCSDTAARTAGNEKSRHKAGFF
ncbi:hypothetical protein PSAC2689_210014 [Paraburkholderia sacchari]